jgi:shikimate dehydrogenase
MTQPLHFALVGENMHYSQSPRIFEAIFKQTGQAGHFDLHSVSRDRLGECVTGLRSAGVNGFSVTIPHKQAVFEYLDEVDPVGQALKAVNSVAVRDGRLYGYNTDCCGVTHGLKRASIAPGDGPALIFGSGGAARAVVYALYHDFDLRQFAVCARSHAGLNAIEQDLKQAMPAIQITTLTDADNREQIEDAARLLVNCTPLGGANHPEAVPFSTKRDWPNLNCYFDLNYNDDNRPISLMRERSVTVVDGSGMLVAQALKSFELWTGREVAFEAIYDEVFGAGE